MLTLFLFVLSLSLSLSDAAPLRGLNAADDANKLLSIETKSLLTVLPCAKVFMNAENVQVYIPEFDWDQLGGIGGQWKHNNLLISGIWFYKH